MPIWWRELLEKVLWGQCCLDFVLCPRRLAVKKHANLILFQIILGGGMGAFCRLYKVNSVRGWLVTWNSRVSRNKLVKWGFSSG